MGSLRTHQLQGRKLGQECHRNGGRGRRISMKDRVPNTEREKSMMTKLDRDRMEETGFCPYLFQRKFPKRREPLAESIPHLRHMNCFQLLKKYPCCSLHSDAEWSMAWNLFFREENKLFLLPLKLLLLLLLFP